MNNYLRIICFSLLLAGLPQLLFATDSTGIVAEHNYTLLDGEWQRTDGNYILKVKDAQTDGKVTVEYFNPKPIHVEQAEISIQKQLMKVFVQLQDTGYEGSTYTLYYYAEKDALAGFYYQAALDRTYKVIFMRVDK